MGAPYIYDISHLRVKHLIQGIHKRMVWLLPQLNTNYDDYILQLDGAPPHFHRSVWVLLNRVLQQRWTGCAAKWDNHLLPWPPRSPDLTPCDLFLWEFIKGSVYIPPLPMSLNEVRDWITHTLQTITADMLHRVWDEFDYRVDVSRVTQGAHTERLWLTHEKLGQLPLLTVYVVPVSGEK